MKKRAGTGTIYYLHSSVLGGHVVAELLWNGSSAIWYPGYVYSESGLLAVQSDLSVEDAVKHFGQDYILTRYDFDHCLGNEESAPLYESPNGSLLELEYRHRGIAISLDEHGMVNTISYGSKPIGTRESRCNPKQRKRSRQRNHKKQGAAKFVLRRYLVVAQRGALVQRCQPRR